MEQFFFSSLNKKGLFGSKTKEKKIIKKKQISPFARLRIIKQATNAALTSNSPRAANAIPTITNFGNCAFSRSSAGTGSAPVY